MLSYVEDVEREVVLAGPSGPALDLSPGHKFNKGYKRKQRKCYNKYQHFPQQLFTAHCTHSCVMGVD